MKRLSLIFAAFIFCLTLAACGHSQKKDVASPTNSTAAAAQDSQPVRITDNTGTFTYEGKLQQIGDDKHGYIKVPDNYVPFKDPDGAGDALLQYSDPSENNVIYLARVAEDYETVGQAIIAKSIGDERLVDFDAREAQIGSGNYDAIEVFSVYEDGTVLIIWAIKDPAHPSETYYLSVEVDTAKLNYDLSKADFIACVSTFLTANDYHSQK